MITYPIANLRVRQVSPDRAMIYVRGLGDTCYRKIGETAGYQKPFSNYRRWSVMELPCQVFKSPTDAAEALRDYLYPETIK